MNKKDIIRQIFLSAGLLLFVACNNEDKATDIIEPSPSDEKMTVSITGTMDDESIGTRSSFVYDESLANDGAAGETFQWNANDQINLRFSGQMLNDFSRNVLSAPHTMEKRQASTTFSGTINKYTSVQTIYAVSPAIQIGNTNYGLYAHTAVELTYPQTVTQKGTDLSHLGATDYMWAVVKDFDLGNDGENLKNAKLDFKHFGAMLRFQIKNTSENNKYILRSVSIREEGNVKILAQSVGFVLVNDVPSVVSSAFFNKGNTILVEDAGIMKKNEYFNAYIMVPAASSFSLGTPSADPTYRFIINVVLTDDKGKEYNREIIIDPATNGAFMKDGFDLGKRYYFVISVNETNLIKNSVDVDVATAGGLEQALINHNKNSIKDLTVTGNIDQRDFVFMNNLVNLAKLDLRGATIKEYVNGNLMCAKNAIPSSIFSYNSTLQEIFLPDNLEVIGDYAFNGCYRFSGDLVIPKSVKSIGYSAFWSTYFTNAHLYWDAGQILTYNASWSLPYDVQIRVPAGMKDAYTAKGWKNVTERP